MAWYGTTRSSTSRRAQVRSVAQSLPLAFAVLTREQSRLPAPGTGYRRSRGLHRSDMGRAVDLVAVKVTLYGFYDMTPLRTRAVHREKRATGRSEAPNSHYFVGRAWYSSAALGLGGLDP